MEENKKALNPEAGKMLEGAKVLEVRDVAGNACIVFRTKEGWTYSLVVKDGFIIRVEDKPQELDSLKG